MPRFLTDATLPLMVLLDGSLHAERTLPIAAQLSRATGNPLVLVRVAERPYLAGGVVNYVQALEEVTRLAQQEAEIYLQRQQFRLLALAAHGQGWLGQVFLGSLAQHLLRQVEVPVLFVRQHPTPSLSAESGVS